MTTEERKRPGKQVKLAGLAIASAGIGAVLALSLTGKVDQGKLLPLVDFEGAIVQEAAAFPTGPSSHVLARVGSMDHASQHQPRRAFSTPRDESATILRKFTVARGDTLIGLMVNAGIESAEANKIIEALSEAFDPRDLRPGQEIFLTFTEETPAEAKPLLIQVSANSEDGTGTDKAQEAKAQGTKENLLTLALRPSIEQDIRVTRQSDASFRAEVVDRPLARVLGRAEGSIESSLALSAGEAGMPASVLVNAIRALSFDVDFQREVRKGDTYEFLYETFEDEDGMPAHGGNVLYAAMNLSGELKELYYYEDNEGNGDYYTVKGESVRRALLRTPVDGARLSSGFGMRKHPVLGYNKMHRGLDFAAPTGTPIYAAGKGKIDSAGRNGGYGNYVRIRHNSTYKTAYAHMQRIAKGISRGKTVKQGQVIGYVGTTGRSTGPHLHYEVLVNNKQVNPLSIKLPSGEKLDGDKLVRFQTARAEIDRLRAGDTVEMVQATCKAEDSDAAGGC